MTAPGTHAHVTGGLLCYLATPSLISHFVLLQAEKRASSPFRRVREEDVEVDARVADNSFDAKVRREGVTPFLKFIFRGREKERERNINWLTLTCSRLGTEPATQAYALTWNQTGDLLVCGKMPNQLSHAVRASSPFFSGEVAQGVGDSFASD